jgi:hypothetical protein
MNDETQWPKSYELIRRELPGASASLHNSIPLRVWLLLCLSTDSYRVDNNKAVRWSLQPAKRSARYAASRGAVIIRGVSAAFTIDCSSLLRCVAPCAEATRGQVYLSRHRLRLCDLQNLFQLLPAAGVLASHVIDAHSCQVRAKRQMNASRRRPGSTEDRLQCCLHWWCMVRLGSAKLFCILYVKIETYNFVVAS